MLALFGEMAPRERAALLAWTSALILVGALPLSFWKASPECFYSPEDFAHCDPWRAIGALADIGATLLMAAALWITRSPSTTVFYKAAPTVGAIRLLPAIAGSVAAGAGADDTIRQPAPAAASPARAPAPRV